MQPGGPRPAVVGGGGRLLVAMRERDEVAVKPQPAAQRQPLASIVQVRPACDERVNAARKFVTEFIDVGGHVVIFIVLDVAAGGCGGALGYGFQPVERAGKVGDDARDGLQFVLGVARAFHAVALGAHVVEKAGNLVQHLLGDGGVEVSFFTSPLQGEVKNILRSSPRKRGPRATRHGLAILPLDSRLRGNERSLLLRQPLRPRPQPRRGRQIARRRNEGHPALALGDVAHGLAAAAEIGRHGGEPLVGVLVAVTHVGEEVGGV